MRRILTAFLCLSFALVARAAQRGPVQTVSAAPTIGAYCDTPIVDMVGGESLDRGHQFCCVSHAWVTCDPISPSPDALYVVRKNGATYEAIATDHGTIAFSGSSFSTVMQSTIDALGGATGGGAGGTIVLSKGTFSSAATIVFRQNYAGWVQVLGQAGVIIKQTTPYPVFDYEETTADAEIRKVAIEGIEFDNNGQGGFVDGNYHCVIGTAAPGGQRVNLTDWRLRGLSFYGFLPMTDTNADLLPDPPTGGCGIGIRVGNDASAGYTYTRNFLIEGIKMLGGAGAVQVSGSCLVSGCTHCKHSVEHLVIRDVYNDGLTDHPIISWNCVHAGSLAVSRDVLVDNVYCNAAGDAGIEVNNCSGGGCTVQNSKLRNVKNGGLEPINHQNVDGTTWPDMGAQSFRFLNNEVIHDLDDQPFGTAVVLAITSASKAPVDNVLFDGLVHNDTSTQFHQTVNAQTRPVNGLTMLHVIVNHSRRAYTPAVGSNPVFDRVTNILLPRTDADAPSYVTLAGWKISVAGAIGGLCSAGGASCTSTPCGGTCVAGTCSFGGTGCSSSPCGGSCSNNLYNPQLLFAGGKDLRLEVRDVQATFDMTGVDSANSTLLYLGSGGSAESGWNFLCDATHLCALEADLSNVSVPFWNNGDPNPRFLQLRPETETIATVRVRGQDDVGMPSGRALVAISNGSTTDGNIGRATFLSAGNAFGNNRNLAQTAWTFDRGATAPNTNPKTSWDPNDPGLFFDMNQGAGVLLTQRGTRSRRTHFKGSENFFFGLSNADSLSLVQADGTCASSGLPCYVNEDCRMAGGSDLCTQSNRPLLWFQKDAGTVTVGKEAAAQATLHVFGHSIRVTREDTTGSNSALIFENAADPVCSVQTSIPCDFNSDCGLVCHTSFCSVTTATTCSTTADCPGGETCVFVGCTVAGDCTASGGGACDRTQICGRATYAWETGAGNLGAELLNQQRGTFPLKFGRTSDVGTFLQNPIFPTPYAAGDATAGKALQGDSATAFFPTGTLEETIGGTGAGAITCTTGQCVSSNGTAYACTSTITGSDLVCSSACVSPSELDLTAVYAWSGANTHAGAETFTGASPGVTVSRLTGDPQLRWVHTAAPALTVEWGIDGASTFYAHDTTNNLYPWKMKAGAAGSLVGINTPGAPAMALDVYNANGNAPAARITTPDLTSIDSATLGFKDLCTTSPCSASTEEWRIGIMSSSAGNLTATDPWVVADITSGNVGMAIATTGLASFPHGVGITGTDLITDLNVVDALTISAAGSVSPSALSSAVPVAKGGSGLATVADDQVFMGSATDTFAAKTVPNCPTGGLNYTQATNAFGCSTIGGGTVTGSGTTGNIAAWSSSSALGNLGNPANCSAGNVSQGIDGAGVAECTPDDDVPEAGDFGALALTNDVISTGLTTTLVKGSASFSLTGIVAPTALGSSPTNNYGPTGMQNAAVLEVSSSVSPQLLTGLAGTDTAGAPTDGRLLTLCNVGSNTITLVDDQTSTASRRFQLAGDFPLVPEDCVLLIYDGNASILRWRMVSSPGTVTSVATGAGLTGGPITSSGTVALSYTTDPASNPGLNAGECVFSSVSGVQGLVCEGATANTSEGVLKFPDPTAGDVTLTLPNETGTVCSTGSVCAGYVGTTRAVNTGTGLTGGGDLSADRTHALKYTDTLAGNPALGAGECEFASGTNERGLICEGPTADTNETALKFAEPTADRTVTVPDETGTICTTGSTCAGYVGTTRAVNTGTGLTGGGDLSANRTHAFDYTATLSGNPALGAGECVFASGTSERGLICEGATADTIEMVLKFPDPASTDKTLTLPNETGTLCSDGSICAGYVGTTRAVNTSTGLSGGGNLSADRTLTIDQAFAPMWTGLHTYNRSGATAALFERSDAEVPCVGLMDNFSTTHRFDWCIDASGNMVFQKNGGSAILRLDDSDSSMHARTVFSADSAVLYGSTSSPTGLTASVNDYTPSPSIASASVLRLTASAAWNVTGLVAGSGGQIIYVYNVDTADTITLKNESASSTAANRFALGGADVALAPSAGIAIQYDGTSTRWRGLGSVGGGGGGGVTGSGTTNAVAKWSSSSALTSSNITDDGTDVFVTSGHRLGVGISSFSTHPYDAAGFYKTGDTKVSVATLDADTAGISGASYVIGAPNSFDDGRNNSGSPVAPGFEFQMGCNTDTDAKDCLVRYNWLGFDSGGNVVVANPNLLNIYGNGTVTTAFNTLDNGAGQMFVTGGLDVGGTEITNVADPTETSSAFSLSYFNRLGIPQSLFAAKADAGPSNSTTETTLLGSLAGGNTIPASKIHNPGDALWLDMSGYLSTKTVTPGTLRIKVYLGATVILDTGAMTPVNALSNRSWRLKTQLTARVATGGGANVMAQGAFEYSVANGTAFVPWEMNSGGTGTANTGSTGITWTSSQVLEVKAQWQTADASNVIKATNAVLHFAPVQN